MNKINKLIKLFASDRTGQILHWLVCGGMAILAVLFIILTIWIDYPSGIPMAIAFSGGAIAFAPPVKAPFWVKLILGFMLAVAT